MGRARRKTIDPVFGLSLAGGRRRISDAVQLGCARSRALALPADAVPERSPRTRDQPTGDGNSSHSHGSSWDRFQTELLPAAPVQPAKRVPKRPLGVALMEARQGSLIVKKEEKKIGRKTWQGGTGKFGSSHTTA